MSLLERIGLVEREMPEPRNEYDLVPAPPAIPEVMVEAEIESTVNIVDEIYGQNELGDKSSSIYTVRALIDTLPEEMTTQKKQSTVAGILSVSGKSVRTLLDDALKRIETLAAARDKVVEERTAEIAAANDDIESLKGLIEQATIKIREAEDIISETKKSVDDEINAINGLVDFCNGMETA